MKRFEETLSLLTQKRSEYPDVLVAFSGGKDACVTLDLCVRTFRRVEAFYMYLVPGLECAEREIMLAEDRWGIKIRRYPHWQVSKLLAEGFLQFHWGRGQEIPQFKLKDIYNLARAEAKIKLIATGAKKSDSVARARRLTPDQIPDTMLHPLIGWNKMDVLAYLRLRGIPIPESSGRRTTGIDLKYHELMWLHDKYPADFKRLCQCFPLAEVFVWRRTFYGV